jgi:hypothetical protein
MTVNRCVEGAPDRRGPAAHALFAHRARAIMLKGSGLADLRYDALVLTGLMLVAMAITVIPFRRNLD